MRQYHTTVKETKEIDKIICNRCGRSIPVIQGVPREDVLEVSKRWGYFSEKDNRLDEFDLCEQCYDEIISEFKIKISFRVCTNIRTLKKIKNKRTGRTFA